VCDEANSTLTCASPRSLINKIGPYEDVVSTMSSSFTFSAASNYFWVGTNTCWGEYSSCADLRVRAGTFRLGCASPGDVGWTQINCP
ncbi:hypothetical protein PRIPAC_90063, partial [Pristionchus pacificus]|uniref:Uncharacterized protein n=1 Tax=Pristionchus pacificus TaxID=54126 RepID=A0A2A6CW12_PRIPA